MKMEVVQVKESPTVQKRPLEVYCRLRGGLKPGAQLCMFPASDSELLVKKPDSPHPIKYKFKKVFGSEASQKYVFDEIALHMVQDLLTGRSGLLFAYGVTGSGKTYTMTGTNSEGGLMSRCLDVLFNTVASQLADQFLVKPDKMNSFELQTPEEAKLERQRHQLKMKNLIAEGKIKLEKTKSEEDLSQRSRDNSRAPYFEDDRLYAVFVTYIEVYNNSVYDLLEDLYSADNSKPKPLQSKLVREDARHRMYVHSVTEVEVRGADEAFEIFYRGQKRKHIGQTSLNPESSRAHTVFTIRLVQAPLEERTGRLCSDKSQLTVSQLCLVDLAGSERSLRTNNSGQRLREAGNINNSLMTLRTCLENLRYNQLLTAGGGGGASAGGGNAATGNAKLVPYRESRLTHLFKNYFEGEGQVAMIVCLSPALSDLEETLHVLKFAELSQEIQILQQPPAATPTPASLPPGVRSNFTPKRKPIQNKIEVEVEHHYNRQQTGKAAAATPAGEGCHLSDKSSLDSAEGNHIKKSILNMFQDLPSVSYIEADDENSLKSSLNFWTQSLESWANINNTIIKKGDRLREKSVEFEREFFLLSQGNRNLRSLYEEEKQKTVDLQGRLQKLKTENGNLKRKLTDAEITEKRLRRELSDKEIEMERLKVDFNATKDKLHMKLKEREEKLNLDFQRKLNKEKHIISSEVKRRDRKLQAVRRIVTGGGGVTDSASSLCPSSSEDQPPPAESAGASAGEAPSSSDLLEPPQGILSSSESRRTPPPQSGSSAQEGVHLRTANTSGKKKKTGESHKFRRHRRSKSAEVWLDHRPAIPVPLGTLLQPVMEKRKSVSKLSDARDITEKTNKYCLMTQSQDKEGELETRLYKADVVPTSGGGAQVTFNDIEVLKQISPTQSPHKPSAYRGGYTSIMRALDVEPPGRKPEDDSSLRDGSMS